MVIDATTPTSSIQIGSLLYISGKSWQVTSIDEINFIVYDQQTGNELTIAKANRSLTNFSHSGTTSFYNLISSNFASIPINSKFTSNLDYDLSSQNFIYSSPLHSGSQPLNTLAVPQRFVSTGTTPNLSQYLNDVGSKNLILATDTEVEHFEGNIWRTKEVYTQAR